MTQIKSFKDLGIAPADIGLVGEKIKIDKVLDKQITVQKFTIRPSKYTEKGNGQCLKIQILYGEENRVIFTGSGSLMETIQKIPADAFPFTTTIKKENDCFQFN